MFYPKSWADVRARSCPPTTWSPTRQRERGRTATGWGSLTPTELETVRLAREGLSNKDIGAALFISPRTVQTHLTHVYTKLGLNSRIQLAQEAARHG